MSNGKIGDLGALALGYVQRGEIPADLPVKTTDDVDQGGGGGDGRGQVSNSRRPSSFVPFITPRTWPPRFIVSSFFPSIFFTLPASSLANERREKYFKEFRNFGKRYSPRPPEARLVAYLQTHLRPRRSPLPSHSQLSPMFASYRTDSTFEKIPIMLVVLSTDQNTPYMHALPLTGTFPETLRMP